jgi:hypothetical protein
MSIDEKPALMNADPNLGLLGSDPDIADQRERQPAADGHTVDRGDHRDVELVKPGEQVRQTDLGVVVDLFLAHAATFPRYCLQLDGNPRLVIDTEAHGVRRWRYGPPSQSLDGNTPVCTIGQIGRVSGWPQATFPLTCD